MSEVCNFFSPAYGVELGLVKTLLIVLLVICVLRLVFLVEQLRSRNAVLVRENNRLCEAMEVYPNLAFNRYREAISPQP